MQLPEIETVAEPGRAAVLLDPLRLRLLSLVHEPASAAELARRVGLPRQRVNYHVRALAAAGFLRSAGRRVRRNMIERRFQATARSYVLAPGLLGPLAARRPADARSAATLVALAAEMQAETAAGAAAAARSGAGLATLSIEADVRFTGAEQRARFARALRDAVAGVVGRHTAPRGGRAYRLVVGCYPRRRTT
jgi:DNA-binding transcriptional ArsR family regulator